MITEDIKKYLPHFLSDLSERELLSELKSFPNNIDSRFYSFKAYKETEFLQGDGIKNAKIVDIANNKFYDSPSLIISNSCDISLENSRYYPTSVCYAPMLSFAKLKESLSKNFESKRITAICDDIKKQNITSIFYLPMDASIGEEKVVFLDRINHMPTTIFMKYYLKENKIFSLSNYGFYVFLLKISIHFTRIRDGVDRDTSENT